MDDALLVSGFERGGDLSRDRQRLDRWHPAARDALGERLAFDELEHERALTAAVRTRALLESIDRADVRMIERCECLRFALEASQPLGIGGEGRGQNLESDIPLESGVSSSIHLTHAARA